MRDVSRHGGEQAKLPELARETAVRVLLFNAQNELLLQKVNVPGKPMFYITPGGRLDNSSEDLLAAVRREIAEETGFRSLELLKNEPLYSGEHVMQKSRGPVKMTEHFFAARLGDSQDVIDPNLQQLTKEEKDVFAGQEWLSLSEIVSRQLIVVPVNLFEFVSAFLRNGLLPEIDFSDPPQFHK